MEADAHLRSETGRNRHTSPKNTPWHFLQIAAAQINFKQMNESVRGTCHPCFVSCRNKSTNHCEHIKSHMSVKVTLEEVRRTKRFCHFLFLVATLGLFSPCSLPHAVTLPSFISLLSLCLAANVCHGLSLPLSLSLSPSRFRLNPRDSLLFNILPILSFLTASKHTRYLSYTPLTLRYRGKFLSFHSFLCALPGKYHRTEIQEVKQKEFVQF